MMLTSLPDRFDAKFAFLTIACSLGARVIHATPVRATRLDRLVSMLINVCFDRSFCLLDLTVFLACDSVPTHANLELQFTPSTPTAKQHMLTSQVVLFDQITSVIHAN